MEALAASTKDFKSLDQVEAKMNELNIKFSRGTGTLDTATLPPEIDKAIEAKNLDDSSSSAPGRTRASSKSRPWTTSR